MNINQFRFLSDSNNYKYKPYFYTVNRITQIRPVLL